MKAPFNPDSHHRRRSIRLKAYDYSTAGAYFVTIVTQERLCVFGDVADGEAHLTDAGEMIRQVWHEIPIRFPSFEIDEFVVMPNHIHGILIIHSPVGVPLVGTQDAAHAKTTDSPSFVGVLPTDAARPTYGDRTTTRVAPTEGGNATLGEVVGAYKSLTTLEYSKGVENYGWPPFDKRLWQRNYYERIIRDNRELDGAREYIANNPTQWELDAENPSLGSTLS